jgi:hypothetical protein
LNNTAIAVDRGRLVYDRGCLATSQSGVFTSRPFPRGMRPPGWLPTTWRPGIS